MADLQATLTPAFACSYLPGQQEQLLCLPPQPGLDAASYGQLMAMGFRRSGDKVYAPRCSGCQACLPLRIEVSRFEPSHSQKRIQKRARMWHSRLVNPDWARYWPLFDAFVTARHGDGGMYPPRFETMTSFLGCRWLAVQALELWCGTELAAVMIVDRVPDALSAVYTFFSPDHADASPGKLAVLTLLALARAEGASYVYLGYQVDECRKMNYKREFRPYQLLLNGHWQEVVDELR